MPRPSSEQRAWVILEFFFSGIEECMTHEKMIDEIAQFCEDSVQSAAKVADRIGLLLYEGKHGVVNDQTMAAGIAQYLNFDSKQGKHANFEDLVNFVAAFRERAGKILFPSDRE